MCIRPNSLIIVVYILKHADNSTENYVLMRQRDLAGQWVHGRARIAERHSKYNLCQLCLNSEQTRNRDKSINIFDDLKQWLH